MTTKKNMQHPNFIIGLLSYGLLLVGIVINANGQEVGKILVLGAFLVGAIHWIASIVDVLKDPVLKRIEHRRFFWFSLIIMIPPMAGMMYYMLGRKQV